MGSWGRYVWCTLMKSWSWVNVEGTPGEPSWYRLIYTVWTSPQTLQVSSDAAGAGIMTVLSKIMAVCAFPVPTDVKSL